jgi:hypothetical protein
MRGISRSDPSIQLADLIAMQGKQSLAPVPLCFALVDQR